MFSKTFAKHFSALTDVRMVPSPWTAIDFQCPVLREGDDEWAAWVKGNQGRSSLIDMLTKAGIKAMLTRTLSTAGEDEEESDGFRRKRKLTKRELRERQKKQEKAVDVAQIVERSVDGLSPAELAASVNEDLNALKPGVALILLSDRDKNRWVGVLDDESKPMPFTPEERLRFLGWLGFHIVDSDGDHHYLSIGEYQETLSSADDPLAQEIASGKAKVTKYEGNPRNEDGALLWVDEEMDYGPGPVGDCLTEWLLDASADGESFKVKFVDGAAKNLGGTPSGGSATSAS